MHYHWTVICYKEKQPIENDPKNFRMIEMVEVSVLAETEQEALSRAKSILKRPLYYLSKVYECGEDHQFNETLKVAQAEMLTKFTKGFLK